MELDSVYSTYKPLLLSIAYRMLGSVAYAEDLVQDVFVSIQQRGIHLEGGSVQNRKAYLCKMITNRCLDYLKSARKKREVYVGPWLPEPLVQDYSGDTDVVTGQDPLQKLVLEDTISYAFLFLLERLTPTERAVFILREAFEYDYRDIADFINKTELGCRKIYSRLKRKIQAEETDVQFHANGRSEQLVLQFLHTTATGDMKGLFAMLAEDIVLYSDGGGKVSAATKPIASSQQVITYIQGLLSKYPASLRLVVINGQLGFMLINRSEPYPTIVSLEFKESRVQRIYLMRNPDKMQHLNLEPYHK